MSSRRQYLLNIAWSWLSAVALIANGVFVAPILIRRLGTDRYGIWVLGLSLVEYFWMIDLGLRPATVKLTAEYRALEKWDKLNALLSTATAYSAVMGTLIWAGVSLSTGWISRFYHIEDSSFTVLIHVISLSWAFGLVANVFNGAIDGFQRFDITGRIFLTFTIVRGALLITVVSLGYGLAAMSVTLLCTQLPMYVAFYFFLRRLYPQLKLSPRLIGKEAGRDIWLYARQIVSGILSARLLQSAIPSMITRALTTRYLTYYSVTQKMLEYAGEGIGRIGLITGPRASDWMARGMRPQIIRMAEYGNKYCLSLWILFATFFLVYGKPLCRVWVNAEFAEQAAILLPFMLFGQTLWLGQFISGSILMGIGRYGVYSGSLMVEALLTVAGFWLALPRWGLVGGVAVASTILVLNRCINLSRIFAREFQLNQIAFLFRIYSIPLAVGTAEALALWVVKTKWLPGQSWPELIAVGTAHSIVYAAAMFLLVLEPDHRQPLIDKLVGMIRRPVRVPS